MAWILLMFVMVKPKFVLLSSKMDRGISESILQSALEARKNNSDAKVNVRK